MFTHSLSMNQWLVCLGSIAILTLSYTFSSCSSTQKTSTTTTGTNALFLPDSYQVDSTVYSSINGSLARFYQLYCGRFVQYQPVNGNVNDYGLWRINDGKDSVMVYHFPVGNPDKDGYWAYNCQVLTSLPDEPIYASFSKLQSISRDTMLLIAYALPDDFSTTLDQLVNKTKEVFRSVDLKTLQRNPGADVAFVRQTPIRYGGEMAPYPDENPKNEGGNLATYLSIDCEKITFHTNVYDSDNTLVASSPPVFLRKLNRLNPQFKMD